MLSLSTCTVVGCTTMQQVERDAVPRALAELTPGDRIAVRTAQMWDDVTVVAVDAAILRIERRSGEQVTLARDDLPDIRVKRRAPSRTIALAAGIFFGSGVALCGSPFENDGC